MSGVVECLAFLEKRAAQTSDHIERSMGMLVSMQQQSDEMTVVGVGHGLAETATSVEGHRTGDA